ncbi:hypothetical protein ACPA9J_00605 [Pseudomonas aeruginosa]
MGIAGVLLVVLLVIGLAVATAMLRLHQIRQNLDDIAAGEGDLTRRLPVTSATTSWASWPVPSTASSRRSTISCGRSLG